MIISYSDLYKMGESVPLLQNAASFHELSSEGQLDGDSTELKLLPCQAKKVPTYGTTLSSTTYEVRDGDNWIRYRERHDRYQSIHDSIHGMVFNEHI